MAVGKRIEWIDIAKGISIILVVLGHTSLSGPISFWLKAFRMPFFFFVSGILVNYQKYPTLFDFLKKRWATIIRPYIIFSIIDYLLLVAYGEDLALSELYTGWTSLALWFIPVLLLSQCLFYIFCKYVKRKAVIFIALAVSAAAGYLCYINNFHFWFKIEVALTAVFFFGLGNISRTVICKFMDESKNYALLICMIVSFVVSFVVSTKSSTHLDMCFNVIGSPLATYTAALSGTLFMMTLSRILTKFDFSVNLYLRKAIQFIGKNSYVVLAFHQVVGIGLIKLFSHAGLPSIFSSAIRHSLMWGILVVLILLINKYIPWVLGREKSKN